MTNQEKFKEVFGEELSVYGEALHLDRLFYGFEYREWLGQQYVPQNQPDTSAESAEE